MTRQCDVRSPAKLELDVVISSKSEKIPTTRTRRCRSRYLYSLISLVMVFKTYRLTGAPQTPLQPHARRQSPLPHAASTNKLRVRLSLQGNRANRCLCP